MAGLEERGLLDVTPTLLEYAGPAPAAGMRGISLKPTLEGGAQPLHGTLFAESAWRQSARMRRDYERLGMRFPGLSHGPPTSAEPAGVDDHRRPGAE